MTGGSPCPYCQTPMEAGFLATSNGSGLFWSHAAAPSRLRPKDLEVLVPTGFGGNYSANLKSERCPKCRRVVSTLP
jgi:hypothetical protein